jgi:hypothetical protein|tara:strand:- start:1040 stop:1525 length:486 start_codon:yes stop_codon:yes gene_type:complete
MPDALQVSHSIALSRGIQLTETGAHIDRDVSLEAWGAALQTCQSLANASLWALGDLLLHAHSHPEWGETYTQFLSLTGKSYSSLTKATYLAKTYPVEARIEGVSWSHHAEAASLPEPERRALLLRARDEGWTREQVRDHRTGADTRAVVTHQTCPSCGHQW